MQVYCWHDLIQDPRCEVLTDKKRISIEADTGAADSIISEHMCKQHFSNAKLSKSDAVLKFPRP